MSREQWSPCDTGEKVSKEPPKTAMKERGVKTSAGPREHRLCPYSIIRTFQLPLDPLPTPCTLLACCLRWERRLLPVKMETFTSA